MVHCIKISFFVVFVFSFSGCELKQPPSSIERESFQLEISEPTAQQLEKSTKSEIRQLNADEVEAIKSAGIFDEQ